MQNHQVGESRQAPGGARGYQIRIPDPKQWNLTILKNGGIGFLPWRKSFKLQVRAIWAGLDVVLEALREETSPVGRDIYNRLVDPHIPEGASPMEWDDTHTSINVYSVLYAHLDVDPIKIVEESSQRCGYEAYRLLSRSYDRYTPETEVALLNNILQMQQWSVKGIKQAESMMREANARIAIWQKRTKSLRAQQELGIIIVICTLLFSKFDSEVRKDVLNAAGRDASSVDDKSVPNGTQRVMVDFEYMKSIVELVKLVDDQNRPSTRRGR